MSEKMRAANAEGHTFAGQPRFSGDVRLSRVADRHVVHDH